MTCQHIRTSKQSYEGCAALTCLDCGARWREWPIAMSDEEYDDSVDLLVRYLRGRGLPDDRTPI